MSQNPQFRIVACRQLLVIRTTRMPARSACTSDIAARVLVFANPLGVGLAAPLEVSVIEVPFHPALGAGLPTPPTFDQWPKEQRETFGRGRWLGQETGHSALGAGLPTPPTSDQWPKEQRETFGRERWLGQETGHSASQETGHSATGHSTSGDRPQRGPGVKDRRDEIDEVVHVLVVLCPGIDQHHAARELQERRGRLPDIHKVRLQDRDPNAREKSQHEK